MTKPAEMTWEESASLIDLPDNITEVHRDNRRETVEPSDIIDLRETPSTTQGATP